MYISLTAALIVMIAGVLSPVFVTIVQGFFSLKEAKMRVAYDKKSPIYQQFAELYGVFYKHSTKDSRQAFVSAAWAVVLICDRKSRKLVLELLKSFEDANDTTNQSMDSQFSLCLESLNNDLLRTLSLFPFLRIRH